MLPAAHRIRTGAEFALVVRSGRRVGRPALVVHALARPDVAQPPRVGIVTGRPVGSAARRNRVRRRIRHLMAERLSRLPEGMLIVIRALPASATTTYAELGAQLDSALRRLERAA